MKNLGKLKINPEKVMKNEELVTIKGGYGGYVSCRLGQDVCWAGVIENCGPSAYWACNTFCTEWDNLVCAGG